MKKTFHSKNLFLSNTKATQQTLSCSKSTIQELEKDMEYVQSQWPRSGGFIVNFEHISHVPNASTVDFKQVSVFWVSKFFKIFPPKISLKNISQNTVPIYHDDILYDTVWYNNGSQITS